MERDITQRTLRINSQLYQKVKEEAEQINSNCNSFLMMLIVLGFKVYKSDAVICSTLNKEAK